MTSVEPISILALDIDGVLTDGKVLFDASGEESKAVSYHDIDAVFSARRRGLKVALVTAEDTPWVGFIAARLEIEDVIRQAKDKLKAIQELAERFGVSLGQICYVGDSDRDAPALQAVGLGMAPANAAVSAQQAARIVLKSMGGHGAIHEALHVLEQIQRGLVQQPDDDFLAGVNDASLEDQVSQVQRLATQSIAVLQATSEQLAPRIAKVAQMMLKTWIHGSKVLILGNGGSAADAQHFAAELVGRFERDRKALAAVALTTDTSILTSLGNDFGEEAIFARQVEALGRRGDLAIAISTSGNSANVLAAVQTALRLGIRTVGLIGCGGGQLAEMVDLSLLVPSDDTARIQEAHGFIIHALCKLVEGEGRFSS